MSYIESHWRTSYDPNKPEYYHPDIQFNTSNSSSVYASSQTMLDDDRFIAKKRPSRDTQGLQTIQRKISRQKMAAEHRMEQPNGDHMFEPSRFHPTNAISSSLQNLHYSPHRRQHSPFPRSPTSAHSFPSELDTNLRHSSGSRMLHDAHDAILSNGFEHQAFHQPQTRKTTRITPKENYSLSNNRAMQPRSTSATTAPTVKHQSKALFPTPTDAQRLKHVRRHEPAHVPSGPSSKTSLITPDSWKTNPVPPKKQSKKKPIPETVAKPADADAVSEPIIEQLSIPKKEQAEKPKKPKRDKSASKLSKPERTPAKLEPPPKVEKTKEEKEKIAKYKEEKQHEYKKKILHEKELKTAQEKERQERLKKLNEQIKKVAQLPLPPSLLKKTSASLPSKDLTEQTRERLLHLLGPKPNDEPPAISQHERPVEEALILERSPSPSSSSSSDSVVQIQRPKLNDQTVIRSRSEPPIPNGVSNVGEQRNQNLLRWAYNLTHDCDAIENKFKYLRPDGTQPFDIVPASREQLQRDNGNLRVPTPVVITNNNKTTHEPIISSKILRPSGRLSRLNQNRTSEYENQQLPGVGNLRDPLLERRIKRNRAATKIQATYRGYTVRKSLYWSNGQQQQQRLKSESNKRPAHKPTRMSSYATDLFDAPGTKLDLRFSDDNFTIGSTLLRHYQRNGTDIIPSKNRSISEKSQRQQPPPPPQKIQKPTTVHTYSDDYENMTSSISSTPINSKQIPQKPRVIQQPIPIVESSTPSTSSSSSSSSASRTPTPQPHVPPNIQRRRSISPPLPPQMSPDNGRPVYHHPLPSAATTTHRTSDERRYSPDALERQLNAELHLLDGVEASMKQVEDMERLRSVALAQQEVVSLAQVLKNKPSSDTVSQQQTRKSPTRPISSSSSSSISQRKRRSPSPQPSTHKPSRHRTTQSSSSSPTSSSSESILTAREKRVRQKFHSETELQAYEKRLKDIEKKVRVLVKRGDEEIDQQQLEAVLDAFEIFDEKRTVAAPHVKPKSSNESSISEDIPVSHKSSSSISSAIQRKTNHDTSEIRTETLQKDSDSSTVSFHQQQSDTVTTDVSDIERRIHTYHEQLKTKKTELDKLKQRKTKDALRRQEDELKKQLQTYDHEIETIRLQPASPKTQPEQKVSVALPPKTPVKSSRSSSTSSISTATKPQESSIAEDLPVTTTASQSKANIVEKRIEQTRPTLKKERDFFDDDDEDEEKEAEIKPLETPREERDTQHDAQSISTATDLAGLSESDNDDSRQPSTDSEKPVLNLNTNISSPLKPKTDSESSSSTTTATTKSEKSSKQQVQSRSYERKASPVARDYDEDFSDASHSPTTPVKEPSPKTKVNNIDIDNDSIQEDFEDKQSLHDTNYSLTSKSSGDEQSEILVLVKKSASTTPRKQDDKTLEEEPPLPPPPTPVYRPRIESINNDDTSHDVSEDEETNDQEDKVDKLTNLFLRTFIDEAIDQGKQIERLKKETNHNNGSPTPVITQRNISLPPQDTQVWLSDDENNPPNIELNEFTLDFSQLDEKNPNEPRVESPRKIVIEEPVKLFVPHTREQVIQICHQAIDILYDQNKDFSNRATIERRIPNDYFTYDQQDSDTDDIRLNRHAYCQMIFDLCVELLHEMYTQNVVPSKYPDWQNAKLVAKRFYRATRPENRHNIEQIIQGKILEILGLTARQITYSKWRVSNSRHNNVEKFETVLDEEIRRTESQWINYDDDCIQMKFDIAESIFDQLVQESITECLAVVDKRLFLSSNSTRL